MWVYVRAEETVSTNYVLETSMQIKCLGKSSTLAFTYASFVLVRSLAPSNQFQQQPEIVTLNKKCG